MRTPAAAVAFLGVILALDLTSPDAPAAAQEKAAVQKPEPAKWEYGVLTTGATFTGKGGPGGGGVPPFAAQHSWTTAAGDVAGVGWKDLAEKLKAEVKDKDAPARVFRVAVLNHLGAQGWELVSESGTTPGTAFTFKRRAP